MKSNKNLKPNLGEDLEKIIELNSPQLTSPVRYQRPFDSQTRGPPPSPYKKMQILKIGPPSNGIAWNYLAGVLALFTTGTQHSGAEIIAWTQACLSKLSNALVFIDDGYVNLLQNILISTILSERILAPAGGPTSEARFRLVLKWFWKWIFSCYLTSDPKSLGWCLECRANRCEAR